MSLFASNPCSMCTGAATTHSSAAPHNPTLPSAPHMAATPRHPGGSAPSEAVPHVVPICDDLLTGFLPEDKGPYALTPNTVDLIPTLGALTPPGGPVQDPVFILGPESRPLWKGSCPLQRYLAHKKEPPSLGPPYDPRYSPTVGSWEGGVSYGRGAPVQQCVPPSPHR